MPNMPDAPAEQYEALFGSDTPRNLRVYAHSPEIAQGFAAFAGVVMGPTGQLSDRLKELVRLRVAFHNQCRSCMALRYLPEDEVSEDLVCSLEKPSEADDLTEEEQAALEYADRMANNHLSVDGDFYEGLRKYFTNQQLVELGTLVALCIGFGRLDSSWLLTDQVPEHFTSVDQVVTPWGATEVIRPGRS
ncbi:MAG TPA: carboxymuconolactone decarboxylase family protein [Pseudonocardia sp.]|jgi:alkylhydroperoxidase family enzyme|nr:carboxymuconolactone decarboxylase family protein [Pseudonocardia sp.]